ncbi:phosphate/phosphite/phosphonate ABC transporter substrate-binding protein [Vibrio sp. SCSIO 43135]|uniref:phosphate/phosphite/phosphonate ABC transporter substrate-binding protein n=1 Tax=Vibrio sp. SCSIO 43135 TaxID=2819096 RepID=UPI0020755313|nr:phosphate/phosphite/phosphonate ABC transporter substrate-binding protein [Vibrio sp. SCSIO 43135]USD42550.1 phosphate/phosphite/phosphonate ABC transporter substrate-binding protein [Vibrio sp. SCSIO 43135]
MKAHLSLLLMTFLSPIALADHITFGIVPQQSAQRLAEQWSPIMQHLSEQTGHTFTFETAADIPTFEQRLKDGYYDFAYMNPYHYTVFSDTPGYKAIAKAKDKQIKGIIVVRKDSNLENLEQLDGATLAFPSPAAFAASVLPRSELNAKQITFKPDYVSSHDSVYLAVAKGLYPAGGGIKRTFNSLEPSIRSELKVLWTTLGYTPHAIAVHPRVATALATDTQALLAQLHTTDVGNKQLQSLKIRAFTYAQDSDWNDVRELNIDLIKK